MSDRGGAARQATTLRIGQAQPRFEDDALTRGRGSYTSDRREEGETAAVFVRSPVAAGRIVALDTAAALAMPGVLAVLTGADLVAAGVGTYRSRVEHPGPDGGPMRAPAFRPFALDAVRYLGEPVAVVIAESRFQAEDAAEAVTVEIEDRPVVVDSLAAAAPGAPLIWDDIPGNLSFVFEKGDRPAVEAALARADRVVSQRLRISRVTAAAIEPRGALAAIEPETGRLRLELGTQAPHRLADELEAVLGWAPGGLRVVARDCGGAFGMKNLPYPEYVGVLTAARMLRRPVRWTATRLESFQADGHARDQWVDAKLGLDAEGRFLALQVHSRAGMGAYLGPASTHPPTGNVGGMAGVYRTPAIHVRVEGVFTNAQPTSSYRGAGRPEATYIIERMIDIAAAELGMDRADLRRRNMIRPDEMPYRTGFVFTYDSGDFPAVLDRTLEMAGWDTFEARRAEARARGRLRGIGIANPIEIAGGPLAKPNPEYARIEADAERGLRLLIGSIDTGQGHATSFRQILSDRLGLDPARIDVVSGDTGIVAQGTGSFGSRTSAAAGAAIDETAGRIIDELKADAADRLEVAEVDLVFEEGRYRVAGTDRSIAFAEVLSHRETPVEAEAFVSPLAATFPNGCHVCEVEIDPETGMVEVVAYVVVDDVGRVINPLIVKGQICGGIAQGLGQALMEEIVYDPATGQLVSASFMDYAMPRAAHLPPIEIESHPVPTTSNPLGVKGAGEAGTVGALPAVVSAVCDALSPFGIRHLDMPATPARIWEALRAAGASGGDAV